MEIEPLNDWILIEKEPAVESAVLVIPDRFQAKPDRGVVLAVGAGRRTSEGHVEPPAFEPGDTVAFPKLLGHDFRIDGQSVLLIRETDILAVLH